MLQPSAVGRRLFLVLLCATVLWTGTAQAATVTLEGGTLRVIVAPGESEVFTIAPAPAPAPPGTVVVTEHFSPPVYITGAIYPVLYTRMGGEIRERNVQPDPLLRYDGADARREIWAIVREAIPDLPAEA